MLWYWLIIVVTLGMWQVFAHLVVPRLIGAAYEGRSLGVMNSLIAGQRLHPLADYLDQWARLTRSMTFIVVTLAVVLFLVLTMVREAVKGAPTGAGIQEIEHRLSWLAVLRLAASFGLLTGSGESYYVGSKLLYLHEMVPHFRPASRHVIWMAPLADVAIFAGLGLVLAALGAAVPRLRSRRLAVFVLSATSLLVLLMVSDHLLWWAALLIALGFASRLSHFAERHGRWARRALERATIGLVPALLLTTLTMVVLSAYREAQRESSLPTPVAGSPNVILITLDTERALSTSLYGYRRRTTPVLEALGKEATVFDRAVSTAPWTLPSHGSMFTGRYSRSLQVGLATPLSARYPTLAEVLTARGFLTAGFAGNVIFCNRLFGLARGFVHYESQPVSAPMVVASVWLGRTGARAVLKRLGHHQYLIRRSAQDINGTFLSWLARERRKPQRGRPFFVFLNYMDPHEPYRPPKPYRHRFSDKDEEPLDHHIHGGRASAYSQEEIGRLKDGYDASIAYLDEQIGWLMTELEKRGILKNTIVMIASDHGESFGEHGQLDHGNELNIEELGVVLLIRWPRAVPMGLRVHAAVSTRDIPATVMDLLTGDPGPFPGASLSRFWLESNINPISARDPGVPVEPLLSELNVPGSKARESLVLGNLHYVVSKDGIEQLFDLDRDPTEQFDLSASARYADTLPMLRARLRTLLDSVDREDAVP